MATRGAVGPRARSHLLALLVVVLLVGRRPLALEADLLKLDVPARLYVWLHIVRTLLRDARTGAGSGAEVASSGDSLGGRAPFP